jgi:ribosomal protein L13
MKVQLILPIASLRGKLNSRARVYFKTVNGKTYVQRCPNRSHKTPTAQQTAARERFSAIAKEVTRMLPECPHKSRKQLWKIATEAYDAAHK